MTSEFDMDGTRQAGHQGDSHTPLAPARLSSRGAMLISNRNLAHIPGCWWLIALVVVAMAGFGVRVACFWTNPSHGPRLEQMLQDLPDQREYLQTARSLMEQGELSFVDPRFGKLVQAFRMPGYPVLVALLGADVTKVRLAQAAMDALTTLLAGLIAWRLTRSRLAVLLAGAAVAFNPYLIYFSGLILTESPTVLLLTLGMWALIGGVPPVVTGLTERVSWSRRLQWWVGVMVLIVAIYFRPSLVLLPVGMAVASCVLIDRPGTVPGRHVPLALVVGLLTLACLLPWAIRNRTVVGEWVFTTTNTGFTWYDGYNPAATGASDQTFTQTMPELSVMNETRRSRYLLQMAKEWAKENPARVVELLGIKLARTFSPVPLSDQFGGRVMYLVVGAAFAVPVMVLAATGLWQGKMHAGAKLFLLLPVIYLGMVHALTVGSLRYRMPIEPLLAVLASAGAASLGSDRSEMKAEVVQP